jgi:hypothetical protein
LCYLTGMIFITIGSFDTTQAAGWVGASNIVLLSLFIYTLLPASGGHVNPIITFTTMITGLTGFSRGISYMSANCGCSFSWRIDPGEFWARFDFTVYKHSFPTSYQILTLARYSGGGCFLRSAVIPPGRAYLIESIMSFILLLVFLPLLNTTINIP